MRPSGRGPRGTSAEGELPLFQSRAGAVHPTMAPHPAETAEASGGGAPVEPSAPSAPSAPPAPRPKFGVRERPLSIEQLVSGANRILEERIGQIWVEGEVSSLRAPTSGHCYFVLKDRKAQLPCVLWRATAERLRFKLEEGQRFVCRGRVGVYSEQGKLQLYVDAVEPAGLGAAALALEQLKRRLAEEGLFAEERKRELPRFPRRIGVVTSSTGAAVRDIIRVIERRLPTPILIAPCKVQGDGAARGIAWALDRVARQPGVDVIIVGRGGGSTEDLSAFNEEIVVRAVARCPVPVISSVGHEVDVTLSDLAADLRAATPTAAGELAVPDRASLLDELASLETRLRREARHVVVGLRARLERTQARLTDPRRIVMRGRQRTDELLGRAEDALHDVISSRRRSLTDLERRLGVLHPRARLELDRGRVGELSARLHAAARRLVARRVAALQASAARLDAMSPLKVVGRGYAIARRPDGGVVASVTGLAPGDPLALRVSDGEIDVTVTGTRKDPE